MTAQRPFERVSRQKLSSAFSDEETIARAKGTAPFGYLTKPFQESALRSTIEMALEKDAVRRQLEE